MMRTKPRQAIISESFASIPLGKDAKGGYMIVDSTYSHLDSYYWSKQNTGYAACRIGGKLVLAHRLIMQPQHGMTVDHINGDKLDNRLQNLRICTIAQNNLNRPARSHSKQVYKGVEYMPQNRNYRARIRYQGKRIHLGIFDNPEEAARAYQKKALELFGRFTYGLKV